MALFSSLDILPPDPILGIAAAFRADPRPEKVNLGVGAYRDQDGKPFVLSSVRSAEKHLLESGITKEYLPIEGDSEFISHTERLIFSDSVPSERFSAQTPGASGALALGARLLAKTTVNKEIYLSDPTWPNHPQIFSAAGFKPQFYPYYAAENNNFNREEFFKTFEAMKKNSAFVIQASCHNPCGIDLNSDDWVRLSAIVIKRDLFPFFDMAYQGFGTDLDQDAAPIRLFASQDIEMMIAYSYSKNMGLYAERTGMLSVVGQGKGSASHIKQIIRTLYSSPSQHGAYIVKTILSSPSLEVQWKAELNTMRERILAMRQSLALSLPELSFILQQNGMFSYTGLTKNQVSHLKVEKGIYLTEDGRISVAGLTTTNLPFVVDAIKEVL